MLICSAGVCKSGMRGQKDLGVRRCVVSFVCNSARCLMLLHETTLYVTSYQLTTPLYVCQVYTGDRRFPAGQCYKSGKLTSSGHRNLASFAEANFETCQQMHNHDTHQCAECGRVFAGKKRLWHHIRTVHGVRHWKCLRCSHTFASRGGLTDHVRHIHEKKARYQCEICGKGYSIRSNYLDHIATHTGAKRNVCGICQKQFTFKYSLKVHLTKCHTNDGTCG